MSVFTDSIGAWVSGLSINSVIMMIMMIFMIVGAVDKIMGNKFGYGEEFENGFNAIGPLAMSMAGVVAAAPVLATLLGPILTPIYTAIGADPSMFATTLLACDMGGYPLAMQLAADPAIGNFAGLILGTMMGPTIVFTIPVALIVAMILPGNTVLPFGNLMNVCVCAAAFVACKGNLIKMITISWLMCPILSWAASDAAPMLTTLANNAGQSAIIPAGQQLAVELGLLVKVALPKLHALGLLALFGVFSPIVQ